MSLQSLGAIHLVVPPFEQIVGMETHNNSVLLDAVGEKGFFVGQVCLEGGSGTKTISAAGSGKIVWRTGSSNVVWSAAGSTLRVGIQDVSTTSSPSQGDGTYDVYKDMVQGTDSITNAAVITSTMSSGTMDLTHGQSIAIGWEMTVRNGADSVSLSYVTGQNHAAGLFPGFTTFLSSVWSRISNCPSCHIEFDDGTIGWILNGTSVSVNSTAQTFNSTTGTADEYGNLFSFPVPVTLAGVNIQASISGNSADFEVCLYKDPLGTPSLIEAITVDATMVSATSTASQIQLLFSTPRTLLQNTAYGITIRPTSANSVSIYYRDWPAKALRMEVLGESNYAIRRLDGTPSSGPAFSEYNGGTAKTRRMSVQAMIGSFQDTFGDCSATLRIGM